MQCMGKWRFLKDYTTCPLLIRSFPLLEDPYQVNPDPIVLGWVEGTTSHPLQQSYVSPSCGHPLDLPI